MSSYNLHVNKLKSFFDRYNYPIALTSTFLLAAVLRYKASQFWVIEQLGGDSTTRTISTLFAFKDGASWTMGGFWLPFYFLFYFIPLYFSYHTDSLLTFNLLLSIFTVPIYYLFLKNLIAKEYALWGTLIFCLLPTHIKLSSSMMSETLFIFFISLSCCFYTYYLKTKKNSFFHLCYVVSVLNCLVRFEGWGFIAFLSLYHIYQTRQYRAIFLYAIVCLTLVGHYDYYRSLESGYHLEPIFASFPESKLANIQSGFQTGGQLLLHCLKVALKNLGPFLPLALISSFFCLGKKEFRFLLLLFFVFFLPLFLQVINLEIAWFERYWVSVYYFLIPLSLYSFELIKNKALRYKWSAIALLVFLLMTKPWLFLTQEKPAIPSWGLKKAISFIEKNYRTKTSRFLVDDSETNFNLDAAIAYSFNFGTDINTPGYFSIKESKHALKDFFKKIKNHKAFILIDQSPLYRKLQVFLSRQSLVTIDPRVHSSYQMFGRIPLGPGSFLVFREKFGDVYVFEHVFKKDEVGPI